MGTRRTAREVALLALAACEQQGDGGTDALLNSEKVY